MADAPPQWCYYNCPDKEAETGAEMPTAGRFGFPSRHCIVGPPSTGKDSLAKAILGTMDLDRLIVVTIRPDTREYDGFADEIHSTSDPFSHLELETGGENSEAPRTCVLLHELEYETMTKGDRERLTTLFRFGSHLRTSVIVCAQVLEGRAGVPRPWRQCVDVWHICGLSVSRQLLPAFAKACSIPRPVLEELASLCVSQFDPLTVDKKADPDSSLRYRICLQPVTQLAVTRGQCIDKMRQLGPAKKRNAPERTGGAVVIVPPISRMTPIRRPLAPEDENDGAPPSDSASDFADVDASDVDEDARAELTE